MRKFHLESLKKNLEVKGYSSFLKLFFKYFSVYLSSKINYPLSGPFWAALITTYKCNFNCKMCNSKEKVKEKEELNKQQMFKIIDDFYSLGCNALEFSGGEPLLRPDLFELIKHASEKKMITHLSTNGYLIDEKKAELIANSGLDALSISLDGANEVIHNSIRGINNSYQKVIQAIENIRKARKNKKMKIALATVIVKKNVEEIEKITKLVSSLNLDYITFIPLQNIGIKKENLQELTLDKNNLKITEKLIELKKKNYKIENSLKYLKLVPFYLTKKEMPIKCYAGYTSCIVDCYGDVFPCAQYFGEGKSIRNLKNNSLKLFWRSKEYKKTRNEIKNCKKCLWNCQQEMNLLFNFF